MQKYCDTNVRCIAILFEGIGARGRFDSPEFSCAPTGTAVRHAREGESPGNDKDDDHDQDSLAKDLLHKWSWSSEDLFSKGGSTDENNDND